MECPKCFCLFPKTAKAYNVSLTVFGLSRESMFRSRSQGIFLREMWDTMSKDDHFGKFQVLVLVCRSSGETLLGLGGGAHGRYVLLRLLWLWCSLTSSGVSEGVHIQQDIHRIFCAAVHGSQMPEQTNGHRLEVYTISLPD
jgi:hypothetical protein